MKIRLKYIKSYVVDGVPYAYLRRKGCKPIRLPGVLGSDEFLAGYHAALKGEEVAPVFAAARNTARIINTLVAEYCTTGLVKRVEKESSRKRQASTLRQWCALENVGTTDIKYLDSKYIRKAVAEATTGNSAYTWFITVREFTKWVAERGIIDIDPCLGIKVERPESKGHDFFDEDQIAQFEKRWELGTRERLLFSLLLYTGQRCSDVRQLGRHSIVNGKFPVTQIKTGVQVYVPVHPELTKAIEACNVVGLHSDTFLATKNGKPIDQSKLNDWFRKACNEAGLPAYRMVEGKKKPTCVPHGLRKQFCVRLAQAGATTHEIAALSGHLSLKEVERYTRDYNREKAGEAGFAKLLAAEAA